MPLWLSSGFHCQAHRQIHAAKPPPFDHLELVAIPRRSCRTVSATLGTGVTEAFFFPEEQGHAVLCPSDSSGDTEVSQLRTGREKATKAPAGLF